MSIEAATEIARESPGTAVPSGRARALSLRETRVLRYALGVTAAAGAAFALQWPLFFLTPILTAFFLSLPLPGPSLRQAGMDILYILAAFVLGTVFTHFFLPFPVVYCVALGLVMFRIYYLANRGGPPFLVLMSLIAVLILPLLRFVDEGVSIGFSVNFVLSGTLAVVFVVGAHGVFPDPAASPGPPARPWPDLDYAPVAAARAFKSTVVIFPLALVFLLLNLAGEILVLVFAAIFSLSPQLSEGKGAGLNSLWSTLLGGLAATVFYALLVAVPWYGFFLLLMLLTTLLFGAGIFSNHPFATYLPSAMIALMILIGGVMGEDVSFTEKLFMRLFLISLATLYVVAVLAVLDRFWFGGRESAREPA